MLVPCVYLAVRWSANIKINYINRILCTTGISGPWFLLHCVLSPILQLVQLLPGEAEYWKLQSTYKLQFSIYLVLPTPQIIAFIAVLLIVST
jgi:hypothetical protein